MLLFICEKDWVVYMCYMPCLKWVLCDWKIFSKKSRFFILLFFALVVFGVK